MKINLNKFEVKSFGVCNLSIIPIRKTPSDEAEIVTQMHFGDNVRILEKQLPWLKVSFPADDYEGWLDFKQLTYLNEEQNNKYLDQEFIYVKDPLLRLTGPRGVQNIMLGAKIPLTENESFILGEEVYTLSVKPNNFKQNLIETAMGYLNTPYLWGGKSIFGIDCSGLVQTVFKVHNIFLSRDASTQVKEGLHVPFNDRKAGDVPFFINKNGKVHHVGILTSKDEILHASGAVRLDNFNEKGIYRKDFDKITHQLLEIRRFTA
ncbi:C40 family peptidase [Crocinitomix algicola]|uniref:C40 family peptidase n=1 Tax=Crocinitomix algicola TaxID=1740263 RepID=UPI000872568A|nr:C40 family peptidase [Crocinitomix algicola]